MATPNPSASRTKVWAWVFTGAVLVWLLFQAYIAFTGFALMSLANAPILTEALFLAGPILSVLAIVAAMLRPARPKLAIFNGALFAAYLFFWLPVS